jgi:adenylate kinase
VSSELGGRAPSPVPINSVVILITAPDPHIAYIDSMTTNRARWLEGPAARCGPVMSVQHAYKLILLGAPGVGKGTQADLLHRRLGACHLSTGDVFRTASKSTGELSPAMRTATEYMRRGELVPDSTVWEMVRERSGCLHCVGGFILDGFPRTLSQAHSLTQLLKDENLTLTAVVNYVMSTQEIVSRLGGRRTCETCKAVFHVTERPSRTADTCDRCGGKLFQREDDRPESVQIRMEAYERSTAPLIEFYDQLGLLMSVPAAGAPDEICARTLVQLSAKQAALA